MARRTIPITVGQKVFSYNWPEDVEFKVIRELPAAHGGFPYYEVEAENGDRYAMPRIHLSTKLIMRWR